RCPVLAMVVLHECDEDREMSHFYFAVALAPLALLALLAVLYSPGPGPSPGHQGPDVHPLPLPDDLLIGAGTSAVQTEGAWDEDGKSESVLDYILHTGRLESAGFQAAHEHDRGADSYHRYKEDVAKAAELKVYRFSISWARVLPEADASKPNAKGVQFYHNLIDEILAHNMKPMVVLYHFDHPQLLEREFNGWRGRRMVDKFREYATFIFKEYGHKVKMWTSLNEPDVYCTYMLGLQRTIGELAPAEAEDPLPCVHHFLLAHGEASRALRETGNGGSIGLSVSSLIARPNSTRPEDAHAAETFNELFQGIMLHPVVFGDYPPVVKQLVGDKLPVFTLEEKAMLANSSDHIGITVYYGMVASYRPPGAPTGKGIFLALKQLLKYLDFVNVAYVSSNGSVAYSFPYDSVLADLCAFSTNSCNATNF
ncbi:Beta-glucosidase 3, partial [Frankliniella fusca]